MTPTYTGSVKRLAGAIVVATTLAPATSFAATVTVTDQEQTDLAVTLYTHDLGLIQDSRTLPALSAEDRVVINDVSKQMQTETLQIRNAGIIQEQTLTNAVLNYSSLLQHHIGKMITLAKTLPNGQEIRQDVRLLNTDGQQMLVDNQGVIESIPNSSDWRILFSSRPDNLLIKPSLTFRSQGTSQSQPAQMSYLTNGLSWQMDYVMTLNDSYTQMNVEGLASLINYTGTDLKQARIRLLAGDIYQSTPRPKFQAREVMMAAMADGGAPGPEAVGDYQLFTLPEPLTLLDQQRTQVPLLRASQVAVTPVQKYRFYIHPHVDNQTLKVKPESFIRFSNTDKQGLGKVLPSGQVRFFAPDKAQELHFVGGAQLGQTAVGEEVEMVMGKAFDVTIHQRQTDFQTAFDGAVVEYELRIQNSAHQARAVEINALFNQPWQLVSASKPINTQNAGAAVWTLNVPGNSDTLLSVRVRLTKQN